MDTLVLLVLAVVAPVLSWWLLKLCLKMVLALVKLAAIGGLALGAAYLTFSQAEFPEAPSMEAKNVVLFLQHQFAERTSKLQLPKLKVDFDWSENAQAEEPLRLDGPTSKDNSRYF